MQSHRSFFALSATALMIATILAVMAPVAQAHHACSFSVGADAGHSPANTWSTHEHPRFTFNPSHCRVEAWEVSPSWEGSFQTAAGDYHPTLGSGQYNVAVRAYYSVDAYSYSNHCHSWWGNVCLVWHTHVHFYYAYYWSSPVVSPTVKIDVTVPQVDISSIDGPIVDGEYLTSGTTIRLSASDAHSGLNAVQTAQDAGAWSAYDSASGARITGDDGAHTFRYRAIDNVGLTTTRSRDFILDNTGPVISVFHPTANSVNVNEFSAETCTDNARVTQDGEVLAEAPDAPGAPVDAGQAAGDAVAAVDGAQAPGIPSEADMLVPSELAQPWADAKGAAASQMPSDLPDVPAAPSAPGVVDEGPDLCGGHVLSTLEQSAAVPGAPAAPSPPPTPETPALPGTPEEVPDVPAVPETPPAPTPPIGPSDVLPPTVVEAIEGALAQLPTDTPPLPNMPGTPTPPTVGGPREEIESAIGPLPVGEPAIPDTLDVAALSIDFANPVVLTGIVEMSANVDDAIVGTQLVEFIVDGVVRSSQQTGDSTYAWSWDTTTETAGEHSFAIRAVDRLGNEDSVEFTVIVLATTPDGAGATAEATQAEAEAEAAAGIADAEATAAAAPGDVQSAAEAAPGEAQAAADAAGSDAGTRASTLQGYLDSRASEALPAEAEDAIADALAQVPA